MAMKFALLRSSSRRRLEIDDIFSMQDEFVLEIARALEITLQDKQRAKLVANGTENVPAYLAYLRGKYASNSAAGELQNEALARYREAITLDPKFARAWLGLARVYETLGKHGTLSRAESNAQVTAHIARALSLDDQLGEAYAMQQWPPKPAWWKNAKRCSRKQWSSVPMIPMSCSPMPRSFAR